jgi:hypothetical protein
MSKENPIKVKIKLNNDTEIIEELSYFYFDSFYNEVNDSRNKFIKLGNHVVNIDNIATITKEESNETI